MFSRKDGGGEPGDKQFPEALSKLKRQGASVLVVGPVRTEQRRDVCQRLLGRATDRPRRRLLVSTTGDDDDVSHLLSDEFAASNSFTHVSYATHSRSATTSDSTSSPTGPSIPSAETSSTPVTTLADLGIAISNAIETFETDANGLSPAELRIGIDSLIPLLEAYGTERVFKFVHLTTGRTRESDGMIHYHLPMDHDADIVSVLEPLFDITIELREHHGVFQERWTINDGDLRSGWVSIERS
ncbi:hypothetical protein RBH26_10785 [Natronolimnohabitans sp. A-GB9]|uniref:DUF7504 family protein n=1 Tax=Natronolimnohabitans sp. A-GB9 TaxID=3069757 RepID=UPI0027B34632|nr:hypothetical protein [Natronolimnohabitans sp. A-GB9]MDQ2050964.1 hypothetical protein [Natronolimnohabitans sp. A-GB9]